MQTKQWFIVGVKVIDILTVKFSSYKYDNCVYYHNDRFQNMI